MKVIRQGSTQFAFASATRKRVSIESIGVVRVTGKKESLIWWIVSNSYSQTWTPVGTAEVRDDHAALEDHLRRRSRTRGRGRQLTSLTYGEVPPEFRQMTPERGHPPDLREGAEYILHITGNDFETFRFTA